MTELRYRSIPPARLGRVRWSGEAAYRVLSYYFLVRWNWEEGGRYVRRVLTEFARPRDRREERPLPTPGMPTRYSIVEVGRGRDRRYQLFYGDGLMLNSPDPGIALESFFWHVNAETVRRTGDLLLVHAGALSTPAGEGVLIVGGSGSGKTTLTGALVRAGFGYLSDEAGAIDPVTGRLYPYPKALTVKAPGLDLFPECSDGDAPGPLKEQWHVPPREIRPGCLSGPCPVRFVVAHRYVSGADTCLTALTPARGTFELGRHVLNLPIYGGRAIQLLAEVARGATHHSLVSGSLEEAVRTMVELTGRTSPSRLGDDRLNQDQPPREVD